MGDSFARDASIVVIGLAIVTLAVLAGVFAGFDREAPEYIGSALLVLVGALAGVARGASQ